MLRYSFVKFISTTALVFILMLNFAVVSHSLDQDPSHHTHHQCELFSIAQNGLGYQAPTLPIIKQVMDSQAALSIRSTERLYFAFLARSPPRLIS